MTIRDVLVSRIQIGTTLVTGTEVTVGKWRFGPWPNFPSAAVRTSLEHRADLPIPRRDQR